MGDLIKLAKAWAVVAMVTKCAVAVALLVFAAAFAFGDGGRLTIEYAPKVVADE